MPLHFRSDFIWFIRRWSDGLHSVIDDNCRDFQHFDVLRHANGGNELSAAFIRFSNRNLSPPSDAISNAKQLSSCRFVEKKSKGSPRLADRNESIIFSSTYLQMHLRVCCSNKAIRKVISLVSQWDAFEGSAQTEWSAVISAENLAAVRWIIRSEVFFIPFFSGDNTEKWK